MFDQDAVRVTGVRTVPRGGDRTPRSVPADLIVDASGRGSHTPDWLAEQGYPEVKADRVAIDLAYTSRVIRLDPDALDGDIVVLLASTPAHPRGAVLQTVEGGRTMLSLIGILGDYPPISESVIAGSRAVWPRNSSLTFCGTGLTPSPILVSRVLTGPAVTRLPSPMEGRGDRRS